jgi:hypothetical protein
LRIGQILDHQGGTLQSKAHPLTASLRIAVKTVQDAMRDGSQHVSASRRDPGFATLCGRSSSSHALAGKFIAGADELRVVQLASFDAAVPERSRQASGHKCMRSRRDALEKSWLCSG